MPTKKKATKKAEESVEKAAPEEEKKEEEPKKEEDKKEEEKKDEDKKNGEEKPKKAAAKKGGKKKTSTDSKTDISQSKKFESVIERAKTHSSDPKRQTRSQSKKMLEDQTTVTRGKEKELSRQKSVISHLK